MLSSTRSDSTRASPHGESSNTPAHSSSLPRSSRELNPFTIITIRNTITIMQCEDYPCCGHDAGECPKDPTELTKITSMRRWRRVLKTLELLSVPKPPTDQLRMNPYSGVKCQLCPEACQLYDFITSRHLVCGRDYTRTDWDTARYGFLELWPDEYFKLID